MKGIMKTFLKVALIIGSIVIVIWAVIAIQQKNTLGTTPVYSSADSSNSAILKVNANDNIRGDKSAPLTIVDYADYQCPYCVTYDKSVDKIIIAYPTQVRWVYRHFPLPFHKAAKEAAIAAEAASAQGKYWEFHDKLVANSRPDGTGLAENDLINYATQLSLNIDQFKKDLTNQKYISKVDADIQAGTDLKVQGTPTSYLIDRNGNAEQLAGALTFDQLKAKIDAALVK